MNNSFGDMIITHFPFTDGVGKKPRPALVLCDTDDGDVTIARITSSIIPILSFTIAITNWEVAGLYKPSILNMAKLISIHKSLVMFHIGHLQLNEKSIISKAFLQFYATSFTL